MVSTSLYLIRHGETDHNLHKRLCGWADPPLNEKGRKQAQDAAKALTSVEIHSIYHSGLKRTEETAQIIQGGRGLESVAINGLREINFGALEGKTMQHMEAVFPDEYNALIEDAVHFQFPQGESLYEMHHRVIKAADELIQSSKNKNLVLVTHAGVIRSIVAHYITGDIHKHWHFKIDHCSITLLEFQEDFCILSKLNQLYNC